MCEIEGCKQPVKNSKQTMCNRHYLRVRRHGDPTVVKYRRYGPADRCEVDPCDRAPLAKGMCRSHYESRNHVRRDGGGLGHRLHPEPRPARTPEQRFWALVDKTETCWTWTGTKTILTPGQGYGLFRINGRQVTAHRFAYELANGPVPAGLDLDHLCRVRACVRPEHLEPVTPYENMMRGEGFGARHARQTHCKRNHEFTPENTRIERSGSRRCRECKRQEGRRYQRARRASCKALVADDASDGQHHPHTSSTTRNRASWA